MSTICPGQDTRYWRPDDIFEVACGSCGRPVEFFKDDVRRRCSSCGAVVQNPKITLGCAQWCEHAKACLGYDPKEQLGGGGDTAGERSLLDRVVEALRRVLTDDAPRLSRSLKALDAVERQRVAEGDGGVDRKVELIAALLGEVGRAEPATARAVMEEAGVDRETMRDVGEVLGSAFR